MATTYEVRLTVVDKGRADPPVGAVLESALADRRVEVSVAPRAGGQGGDDAVVRLWLDAQDSSDAKLMAVDAVRDALDRAGLQQPAVELGDPDARTSS